MWDNPEKRGGAGVDIEMGGFQLFYYFTVQLHLLCVCVWGGGGGVRKEGGDGVKFLLLHFYSSFV